MMGVPLQTYRARLRRVVTVFAALAAVTLGPGGALLHFAPGLRPGAACLATDLGMAFVASSLALAAEQLLAARMRPREARLLDAAWLCLGGLSLALCLALGWLTENVRPGEAQALLAAGGLGALWLFGLPLSGYPGNISLELGDIPASYRVAANLAQGRGLTEDYFIGEFLGGQYHYVTRQPILAYIAAWSFRLFGQGSFVIHLYSQMAALLVLLLTASLPFVFTPAAGEWTVIMPWLVLGLGLLPTNFVMMGLGTYTLPTGVAFLCLASLGAGHGPWLWALAAAAGLLAYMFWLRPEGQLLALLCVAGYGLAQAASLGPWGSALMLAAGLACAVFVWLHLPAIVERLPASFKNLIVFYLRYDPDTDAFVPSYSSISQLMGLFNDQNLFNPRALDHVVNNDLALEIKAHPAAFLRYLGRKMLELCRVVVLCYTVPFRTVWECMPVWAAEAFVLTLFGLGLGVAGGAGALAVCFLYFFSSAIFNELWVRHVMIVTPALTVLAVVRLLEQGQALPKVGLAWLVAAACAAAAICVLEFFWLARTRRAPANSGFEQVFERLRPHVTPETVVLNTYPQLFAFALGCRSVGTTFLVDTLEHYIRRYRPEFIVIDAVRGGDVLVRRVHERFGGYVPGYVLWDASPVWGMIYRAADLNRDRAT